MASGGPVLVLMILVPTDFRRERTRGFLLVKNFAASSEKKKAKRRSRQREADNDVYANCRGFLLVKNSDVYA